MAEQSGIHIKKENVGKFTSYCKRLGENKVTQKCISKAKQSNNELTRRRAIFAENSRKWGR